MSSHVQTVSASLTNGQRDLLLRRFGPKFINVFCVQMTWAYNIPKDFEYPRQELELTITGHHIGDGHEALVGLLSDRTEGSSFEPCDTRPDGKLVHITLSTAEGVPPAAAGSIDPNAIIAVAPVSLTVRLHKRGASRIQPTRLAA